jgi:hypothetical protein
VGIDLLALDECLDGAPQAKHEVWRPYKRHGDPLPIINEHGPYVQRAGGRVRVHQCMPGTDYPFRNLCMLQQLWTLRRWHHRNLDVAVVALPSQPEQSAPRSGTWLCVRQAKAAGLPVQLHPLY